MKLKTGDRVRYIQEKYWFPNDDSKIGEIKCVSDSGRLATVAFNDFQELSCYERELELIEEEK